jgi:hypothetical protein
VPLKHRPTHRAIKLANFLRFRHATKQIRNTLIDRQRRILKWKRCLIRFHAVIASEQQHYECQQLDPQAWPAWFKHSQIITIWRKSAT